MGIPGKGKVCGSTEARVEPISFVKKDETAEGGGDCQREKGITNIIWGGPVDLILEHWGSLDCLCIGGWEGNGISSNYQP